MITEVIEIQKEENIDYPICHYYLKSYQIAEAKNYKSFDMMLNVYTGNSEENYILKVGE